MASPRTQDNVYLSVHTPLGKDKLILQRFSGQEGVSELFHYTVETHSIDHGVSPGALVGKRAVIEINDGKMRKRFVHGVVSRFSHVGWDAKESERWTVYHLELRPWLWLLTLTTDSRIFQNQSVPDILQAVFSEAGFSDFRLELKGSYAPREYCVQYQETSFNFVARLMEDEGMFYFFEHSKGSHVLVISDDADAFKPIKGDSPIKVEKQVPGNTTDDYIGRCVYEEEVYTNAYAMQDYNFEIPTTDLLVKTGGGSPKLEIYEYPGGYMKKGEGEKRAKKRVENCEEPEKTLRGEAYVRTFVAGGTFTLDNHESGGLNQEYVLRRLQYRAEARDYHSYDVQFEAFPKSKTYRAPHRAWRPRIPGTQTALVVGKKGEEIWTDKYGRIKVQFYWDRKGKKDENSSCWIRVSQMWAGKGWGRLFLPRIGQEVVVSFLEGDPDRPLVTGAVYNAEQTVPYALPAHQTKSTVKTNSSKGGGGYNELRFEDKKGDEEVYLQAEKDHNILVKNNETHLTKGTRDVEVWKDETHTNKANYTWKVKGNLSIEVDGNITVKGHMNISSKADLNWSAEAGINLTTKAGVMMEHKAGAMGTVDGGGLLTIKAGLVTIN